MAMAAVPPGRHLHVLCKSEENLKQAAGRAGVWTSGVWYAPKGFELEHDWIWLHRAAKEPAFLGGRVLARRPATPEDLTGPAPLNMNQRWTVEFEATPDIAAAAIGWGGSTKYSAWAEWQQAEPEAAAAAPEQAPKAQPEPEPEPAPPLSSPTLPPMPAPLPVAPPPPAPPIAAPPLPVAATLSPPAAMPTPPPARQPMPAQAAAAPPPPAPVPTPMPIASAPPPAPRPAPTPAAPIAADPPAPAPAATGGAGRVIAVLVVAALLLAGLVFVLRGQP